MQLPSLTAALIAVVAVTLGTVLGVLLGRLVTSGADAYTFAASRALLSEGLVVIAGLLCAAITLRRVLRIDPASAIGSAT